MMEIPEGMKLSLKTAREWRGLKQDEAAQLIGVSKDTLGNYERGKSYPDIPVLRKIEEVYGVPYDRLIFLPLDYDKTVNFQ
jgi:transcriptional regulator with XRE-family HTH domain